MKGESYQRKEKEVQGWKKKSKECERSQRNGKILYVVEGRRKLSMIGECIHGKEKIFNEGESSLGQEKVVKETRK